MLFEKKKIRIETLSEYLKEIREKLNLPLSVVAGKTNVNIKFLESLESGRFKNLPPDVYVFGFLRQLGEYYSVEPEILIEQYKKEKNIQTQLEGRQSSPKTWASRVLGKIIITPKRLSIFIGLMLVIITVVYIVWQVLSINRTPSLQIFQPQDREIVKGSYVLIKGSTDPGILVTVNEEPVYVNKDGSFAASLSVAPGSQILRIKARNKFEKNVEKTITIVGGFAQNIANQGSLRIKLEFSGNVALSYSADDQPQQTQAFNSGGSTEISANKKITISVSDAGATKAEVNGQDLGTLGRRGERLENITFFAESGNMDKQ